MSEDQLAWMDRIADAAASSGVLLEQGIKQAVQAVRDGHFAGALDLVDANEQLLRSSSDLCASVLDKLGALARAGCGAAN